MVQSVKHPTLDFSSDHYVMIHRFEPHVRVCADITEPAWDSLSLSLSTPPPLMHAHSLSQNKLNFFLISGLKQKVK